MWNHGFNYTHTCQQIPFSLLNTSQAGQECEQRKSALVTWTSRVWAVLHSPSQTFTVITFPWFLLCDSCLVNIAAGIHYLIFSLPVLFFSSPLGECQSTTCGLFHYVNSCCPSALPFPCTSLYDSAIRFGKKETLRLFHCDFDQGENVGRPRRRASSSRPRS